MKSNTQFQALHGCSVSRKEVEHLLTLAQAENNCDVVYRLSKILRRFPNDEIFNFEILQYPQTGLTGVKHTGDYKEALDDCGRLRPGYKFEAGKVVKVKPKIITKSKQKVNTFNKQKKQLVKLLKINNKKVNKKSTTIQQQKRVEKVKNTNGIFDVLISKINIDKARFQNRNKLNETVLNQIVKNFSDTKLDPIMLWIDKNKKTYLLAGHHRLEASKIIGKKTIAAKYFNGSEKEAIHYAKVESNANRSLELPQERAKIYREMFVSGMPKNGVSIEAKKIEGKNANYILNLSYLNPKGIVLQAVDSLSETSDKQNATLIEKIADWIGEARRNNDYLTNAHEKEMFDFLQDKEASKRITNKAEFLQKIVATAGGFDFDSKQPLNLKRFKHQTQGEQVYNIEYKELQSKLDKLLEQKADINDRIKNPKNPNYINPDSKEFNSVMDVYDNAISKINTEIKHFQKAIIELQRKKGSYTNAGSNQVGLFGPKKKPVLKAAAVEPKAEQLAQTFSSNSRVKKIGERSATQSHFYTVTGEVGKFLQRVEKKPFESVVITIDGEQGAGKTTTLYQFMDAFASAGNKSLFISGEEHPESELAIQKTNKYISAKAKQNLDAIGKVNDVNELYSLISDYDIIFIDSWQKLQRMVGAIRLDEDLRQKFDGKVFVIIFQQTTTGRTKGGAEVVFDGDIIIKMVKSKESFSGNYAYFDKNRYTLIPIETIHYNIAKGKIYNPLQPKEPIKEVQPTEEIEFSFNIK